MEETAQGGLTPSAVDSEQKPNKASSVVGLLFSEHGDSLILAKVKRSLWQGSVLDGVSGPIVPPEAPGDAMTRTCIDSAGVNPEWHPFATLEFTDHILHFFAANDKSAYLDARTLTAAPLMRVAFLGLNRLPDSNGLDILPSLGFLIAMGHHHLFQRRITSAHITASGGRATY